MKLRWTPLILGLWLAVFFALVFLGDQLLPSYMQADADTIRAMTHDIQDGATSKSYRHTAMFFAWFPSPSDKLLLAAIGTIILVLFMKPLHALPSLTLACFLTIFPMVTSMMRPQKEVLLLFLIIPVVLIARSRKLHPMLLLIPIVGLYCIYATWFRSYYYLIAFLLPVMYVFLHCRWPFKAFLLFAAVPILLLLPAEVFQSLQEPRDLTNFTRFASGEVGSRTAFLNLYQPDSLINFLLNYAYAALRLNLPIFFDPTWKEFLLFATICLYLILLRFGANERPYGGIILTPLFLSHIVILLLFEPDLGSYTRHLSSIFLYLLPGLVALDRSFVNSYISPTVSPSDAGQNERDST